ncbi:transposase domain-containing protein [Thetidibacter halocola]|uniref:Transposase domain-containing protein n=1 Tax=Thetidibacter halocola TaxID=2827239 RepID=A0A8J7W9B2_9RHOB|nr:transposase domain-containing protein [Thetidibacter halocola]MBS0123260.1 transposase domain-containing protein [Thetidibacter halocola]
MLASLVATCKLSGLNPVDYLADTRWAILDGHPRSRIEDLVPWRCAAFKPRRMGPDRRAYL